MNKSRILFLFASVIICLNTNSVLGQEKNYLAPKVEVAPVIDGIGDEKSWSNAQWAYINQPYDGLELPDSADFFGRYKVTWSDSRLYVLMEITDEKLVDDRVNPTTSYWDDDCTEFFIDEDYTSEGHECGATAYNAFAYHIAAVPRDINNYKNGSKMSFDSPDGINHVIDLGSDCNTNNAMNFDDHVNVKIKKDGNKYTWELEFKIFDKSYNENSLSNTPVSLSVNKVMGFAIAYCDDDDGQRDNMIGDIPDHYDYNGPYPFYRFTNEFGKLTLVDTKTSSESLNQNSRYDKDIFYPNPTGNSLNFRMNLDKGANASVNIFNLSGQLLMHEIIEQKKQKINVSKLSPGTYIIELCYAETNYKQKFIKN